MFFNMVDKSVLIVDDSIIMRLILVMNLKRFLGVRITEAVNGRDALGKFEEQKFDLVLTDMVMPEMDGAELIWQIRTRLMSDVPIVVITTKGERQDRERGMSLGANGYLTKPVNMVELVRTVLAFLGEKKL
jgi:two-component system, chemotaxis family, chemotaxis protein CheY